MESVSQIAANRYLIKSKKNARYREGTFKEAFNKYPLRHRLCFTSFKTKLSNVYKKPHRLSDLCDVCETGKVSRIYSNALLIPATLPHLKLTYDFLPISEFCLLIILQLLLIIRTKYSKK